MTLGLAGTVWTADQDAGLDVTRRVRAGLTELRTIYPTAPAM